jgi:hypothetical protein
MAITTQISEDAYCPCGSGEFFAGCHGKTSSGAANAAGHRSSIIDAVTFFKEAEILQLRLELLWDVVDKFVVVEADRTHSGEKKPLLFPELALSTLKDYRSKIVFHSVQFDVDGLDLDAKPSGYSPRSAHWKLENAQRNEIDRACRDLSPFDVLMISDVDEIPDPDALKAIFSARHLLEGLPLSLHQHLFYYKLKYLRNEQWIGSVVTTVGKSRLRSAHWHRAHREMFPVFSTAAGWHLSYFGGSENIKRKLESFAHQEFNNPTIKSDEHIERCVESGTDLYGRPVDTTYVSETFFPKTFVDLTNRRREFFW